MRMDTYNMWSLVEAFYNNQITLRTITTDLDAEEMDKFIDMYDEFVKNGSHNAP